MQTIDWDANLGFLAQHGNFYKSVKEIFAQAAKQSIFHPAVELPELPNVEWDLLERDNIRSSTFRISGFGAEEHTVNHDTAYTGRDREEISERGLNAFIMSKLVHQGLGNLHSDFCSDLVTNIWSYLQRNPQVLGSTRRLALTEMKYDAGLLTNSSEFISRNWLALHRTLSKESEFNQVKPQLMIWFSTLAFAPDAHMQIIQTLASFFMVADMAHIALPLHEPFRLKHGFKINASELKKIAQLAVLPLARSPEATMTIATGESQFDFKKRQQNAFLEKQRYNIDKWVQILESQWPCEVPSAPRDLNQLNFSSYIDVARAMQEASKLFKEWFENRRLYRYLEQIKATLDRQRVHPVRMSPSIMIPPYNLRRPHGFITVDDIFACPVPFVPLFRAKFALELLSSSRDIPGSNSRLPALIKRVAAQSSFNHERKYVKNLEDSQLCLQHCPPKSELKLREDEIKKILSAHLKRCREHVDDVYHAIILALSPPEAEQSYKSRIAITAADAEQWPRLSPILLLQQLARTRWEKISQDWKRCIVHYGVALTDLQRAQRLVKLSAKEVDLVKELQNLGHTNWNPLSIQNLCF